MMHWLGTILGVLFSYLGTHKILTGEPGNYHGLPIPAWVGWIQLPAGLWVLFFSIRALKRDWHIPKPPVNIDEEAARAEAEMDAMYLREHGTPPEKPKKDA